MRWSSTPDDDTRDRLLKKRDEQLRLQRLLETLKGQANVTKDGKTIRIYCNIGSPEECMPCRSTTAAASACSAPSSST